MTDFLTSALRAIGSGLSLLLTSQGYVRPVLKDTAAAEDISNEIYRVFPDNEAYGIIADDIEAINHILPVLGRRNGYNQFAGSIFDGSFACASRKKKFDVDFTLIINHNPLVNPKLIKMQDNANYVKLKAHPGSAAENLFAEYIVAEDDGPIVSPIKVVQDRYSPIFGNISKMMTGDAEVDPEAEVPDDTWYEMLREIATIDITPAVACREKGILQAYRSRERGSWPSESFLYSLRDKMEEFYLVPKSLRKQEESNTWRISFSSLEPLLFKELSIFQRRAYTVFKLVAENIGIMYIRADLLTTYHLKTVFLWSVEQDALMWDTFKEIGEPILHLFKKVIAYLDIGSLPFYFDDSVSLFHPFDVADKLELIDRIENFLKSGRLRIMPPFPFIDSAIVHGFAVPLGMVAAYVANIFVNSVVGLMFRLIEEPRISSDHTKISKAFVHEFFKLVTGGLHEEQLDVLASERKASNVPYDFYAYPDRQALFIFAAKTSKIVDAVKQVYELLKSYPKLNEDAFNRILQGQVEMDALEIPIIDKSRIDAFRKCIEYMVFVFRKSRGPAFED